MDPVTISALISAAASIGGKLYGDVTAKQNAQKQEDIINGLQQKNESWYQRRYNEDFTQRADAQRVLQQASEGLKNRNKAAQGRAAVMGATEEGVAAEKQRNNAAYGDALGSVAAASAASKAAVEQQYQQTNAALQQQMAGMHGQRAANASMGGAQMMQAGGQLLSEILKEKEGK